MASAGLRDEAPDDVFVSYKRRLRPRVNLLAEKLRDLGLKVWFDAGLVPGVDFNTEIAWRVERAKCVLVCWTPDAFSLPGAEGAPRDVGWVRQEADIALERSVIVPVLAEPTRIQPPFRNLHTESLTAWLKDDGLGPGDDENWQRVLRAIGPMVQRLGLADYARALDTDNAKALRACVKRFPDDALAARAAARAAELEALAAAAATQAPAFVQSDAAPPRPPLGARALALLKQHKRKAIAAAVALPVLCVAAGAAVILVLTQGLPSVAQLRDFQPPSMSQVFSASGERLAELSAARRRPVRIEAVPDQVKLAFIAADDPRFYERGGGSAIGGLFEALFSPARSNEQIGITRRMTRMMFFGLEPGRWDSIREQSMTGRVERALSKERILEFYLNEIEMGRGAFGVAAASIAYFDKGLSDLTLSEAALLAGMAENWRHYDPDLEPGAARARRDEVISAMVAEGFATEAEGQAARAEAIATTPLQYGGEGESADAWYLAELRRQLVTQYGPAATVEGLVVFAPMNTAVQQVAVRSLQQRLQAFDARLGFRGAVRQLELGRGARLALAESDAFAERAGWENAIVVSGGEAPEAELAERGRFRIVTNDRPWAARSLERLTPGAMVRVERTGEGQVALRQQPQTQAALVAMDPHTGRVLALVGGFVTDDNANEILRGGDMERDFDPSPVAAPHTNPGTVMLPFTALAALQYGEFPITPGTLIDDGPLAIETGDGSNWTPENYTREYLGPTPLRRALELGRRSVFARLSYEMGPERMADTLRRMQVIGEEAVTPTLQSSVGEGGVSVSLLNMTLAYAQFVNGGRRVQPVFVDRVSDRAGRTLFRADNRPCEPCGLPWTNQPAPYIPDGRQQTLEPVAAYQIVAMLEGAAARGLTPVSIDRPIAGAPGLNEAGNQAWYVGFTPDLVTGVWVGSADGERFARPQDAARLAADIFGDFMGAASADVAPTPYRIPAGVRLVRVDAQTGLLPGVTTTETILEAFRPGTEPTHDLDSPFVFGGTAPIDPRLPDVLREQFNLPPDGEVPDRSKNEGLDGLY